LESRGDLEELKDDPSVKLIVTRLEGERQKEELTREREKRKVAAKDRDSPPPPAKSSERASPDAVVGAGANEIEIAPEGPPGSIAAVDREWDLMEEGADPVTARLVGLRDGDVELMEGDRKRTHPIVLLKPNDVVYVYDVLESRGELLNRGNLNIRAIVIREKSARRFLEEQRSSETVAETESPTSSPEANEPSPDEPSTPAALAKSSSPLPPGSAPQAPPLPTTSARSSATSQQPGRGGVNSNDPWERDQAVMETSNRAAYLFLSGVLALLVVFGPVVYALRKMR
jgi:hypothetical protein